MEIRRFGYGHRRPEGPVGSHGVQAAVIHSDSRGTVAELAFARKAAIEPHSNPNGAWFVVIEGGGFVTVGDETARVFAGEAVRWPAGVPHGAATDLSEMRAIVVELAGGDDADADRGILPGSAAALGSGTSERGEGSLVERAPAHDPSHGEPA